MKVLATERASALWDNGSRWDAVLERLRAEGYSKLDCVRASTEVLRLPLADAKRLVHEGEVWRDLRHRDDEWHGALIAELRAEAWVRRRNRDHADRGEHTRRQERRHCDTADHKQRQTCGP